MTCMFGDWSGLNRYLSLTVKFFGAARGHFLFAMLGSLLIIGRLRASSGLNLSVEGPKSRILTKSFR